MVNSSASVGIFFLFVAVRAPPFRVGASPPPPRLSLSPLPLILFRFATTHSLLSPQVFSGVAYGIRTWQRRQFSRQTGLPPELVRFRCGCLSWLYGVLCLPLICVSCFVAAWCISPPSRQRALRPRSLAPPSPLDVDEESGGVVMMAPQGMQMTQLRPGMQVLSADGRPIVFASAGQPMNYAANPMYAHQQQQNQQQPSQGYVAGYPVPNANGGAVAASPPRPPPGCEQELTRWLENHDVAAAEKQLVAAGVGSLAQLEAMSEEQVLGLGLLPVMRNRLLDALRTLPARAA